MIWTRDLSLTEINFMSVVHEARSHDSLTLLQGDGDPWHSLGLWLHEPTALALI